MELIRSLLLHRRPSPHYSWVGSCITFFEACSAFTQVTTCRLAESPCATLYTGGSDGFVTSTAAPIATGWSDPVPGRDFSPAVVQRLSRRTVMGMLVRRDGFESPLSAKFLKRNTLNIARRFADQPKSLILENTWRTDG